MAGYPNGFSIRTVTRNMLSMTTFSLIIYFSDKIVVDNRLLVTVLMEKSLGYPDHRISFLCVCVCICLYLLPLICILR